uniref:CCHC-type domain-containing protein n=1 Tax=Peronospora matthiolae TaxID=2874970 RepID=A0AAV1T373_9STRA
MDMYTQVKVFVDGMREEQTRLSLERAEPATLEEAFAIALREDFRVTKAYTKPSVVTAVKSAGPAPMEIYAIDSSGDRRRATFYKGDVRSGRQMICFRCQKPGDRAAECRAPAPMSVHATDTYHEGGALITRPKTEETSRCRAPYRFKGRSVSTGGSPTSQSICAACTVKCHHCEW